MRTKLVSLAALMLAIAVTFSWTSIINAQGNRPTGRIWSHCDVYGTRGTKTAFKPGHGPFDELYNGANFKDGVGAISESAPGDTDFNGGRWHVNSLKDGVDADKYSDACCVEDLDLNDFKSTSTYFECPMLPRH